MLYKELCYLASSGQHPGCRAILKETSGRSAQKMCAYVPPWHVLTFILLSLCVAWGRGQRINKSLFYYFTCLVKIPNSLRLLEGERAS